MKNPQEYTLSQLEALAIVRGNLIVAKAVRELTNYVDTCNREDFKVQVQREHRKVVNRASENAPKVRQLNREDAQAQDACIFI